MAVHPWKEIVRQYYLRGLYFSVRGSPDYFHKPWRLPTSVFTQESVRRLAPANSQPPAFVFWPMSDWHARLQRPQHLAAALADAGHICYFLNPHLGRQFPRVYPLDRKAKLSQLGSSLIEIHIRLPREPVYHHRMLTDRETTVLANAFDELAPVAGDSVVQIVAFPTWMAAAVELRRRHGWPIVYDCHDYLAGFTAIAPEIVQAELPAIGQSDHVLFSSLWLEDHVCSEIHLESECRSILRNAVQIRFLQRVTTQQKRSVSKTVGYFGALDSWFDIESVGHAAERFPDVSFRLIGRVEYPAVLTLQSLPNIELKGEVPHDDLPRLLANFDVGLIPFQINNLTRAANPIKLYEYFSAGIPVVSSRLPEVERFGELVYLADDAYAFAECVGNALAENNDGYRTRRIAAAEAETWDKRADFLLNVANDVLARAHRDRTPT